MSLFSNLFKRGKIIKEPLMAIDIGTESVKAAVFSVKRGKEPGEFQITVHSAARENFKGEGIIAPAVDFKNLSFVFRRAVSEAARLAKITNPKFFPKEITVGLDSSLAFGFPVTVYLKRENPQEKIDAREIKNIIQKMQREAKEEARRVCLQKLQGLGIEKEKEPEIELISSAIQQVMIDGYQVSNPVGFTGKEIAFSIFNAYIPKIYFNQLQEIFQSLSLKTLFVVFTPFVVFQSLKELKKTPEIPNIFDGAIMIDVGGEQTQIFFFSKGRFEHIKSVSLGGNAFTRKIAAQIGVGFWEAEEIKQRYSERRLSEAVSKKLGGLLEKDVALLRDSIKMALEEFPKTIILPSEIFVCGGAAKMPGVREALSGEALNNQYFFEKPKVKDFNFSDFFPFDDRFNFLKDSQLSTLSASIYFSVSELMTEETGAAKILKKISGLFR